jgi:hypothetical protein
MLVRLIAVLLALGAAAALYVSAALNWSYATGEHAGWVLKIAKRGWVCKTWEGELSAVSMPGAVPERIGFTVVDDAVAQQLTRALGRRVSLRYEEKVGLPTSCFGETRQYVTGVTVLPDAPAVPASAAPASAAGAAVPAASAPGAVPAAPAASAAPG